MRHFGLETARDRFSVLSGAVAGFGLLLSATSASSQIPPPIADTSAPIETVRVTAQKQGFAQSEQAVPISLTAINSVDLAQQHVANLQDLTSAAPNVSLVNAGIAGFANFTIRGLGTNSTIPSVEPAVGVFVNGIYLGVSAGVVVDDLFDIDDVEILRGPQGLLFGRNTTGGAVLINTHRPGDILALRAQVNYETGPEARGAISVEGPVSGHVNAELSYAISDDQGWFRNLFDERKIGGDRTSVFRPTFVWAPTMAFDSTLILEHGSRSATGPVAHNTAKFSDFTINLDNRGYDNLDWESITLESNWRTHGVVTNLFGYRQVSQEASADIDGTPLPLFNGYDSLNQHQFSDELRYSGQIFDQLFVTTGVYFFTQTFFYLERRVLAHGAIDSTLGGHLLDRNYAVFANADYRLTPEFTLTAGGRFAREEKAARVATFVPSTARSLCNFLSETCNFNFPGPAFPGVSASDTWNNFIPKLGFEEQPNPDLLIYGNWTEGVRSGGYNVRNSSFTVAPGPYGPETQNAFELGAKSDWFDHRLRVNADAFYDTVHGLQRDINVADPIVGVVQVTENTGDATIRGFEFASAVALNDEIVLTGNTGFTDGKYTRLIYPIGTGGAADLHLWIPRLSKWTYDFGAAYHHLFAGGFLIQMRADYGYRSRAAYSDNNATFLLPVENLSASASIELPDGHWALSLYGHNLLNRVSDGENVALPPNLGGGSYRTLNEGRVSGVQLGFRY